MSVEISYTGQTGNNLFQYLTGRIFCEKNGLKMITEPTDTMKKLIKFKSLNISKKNDKLEGSDN